jgi:alpha-galactosidase
MGFRPGKPAPQAGFQGEGILAVLAAEEGGWMWTAPDPAHEVPSIRLRAAEGRLVVFADGPVVERSFDGGLGRALGEWADALAVGPVRPLPPGWCSWYCYRGEVTAEHVLANLAAIERLELRAEVVQIDDGHQMQVGDWLEPSSRFGSRSELAKRIRASGRRAGLWTTPFLVAARSRLSAEHPDWLVGGASAGHNWGDELRVLDVTHPDAAEHLEGVYRALAREGFDYHKLDFLYAGALDGRRRTSVSPIDAYREGLRIVRRGAGGDAILVGCGAPLLPSVGLVDAMRVSPDVDPCFEPRDGDLSQPSMRGALAVGRARSWMHGRLWVNDPDCLILRPELERREEWAAHVAACGGLVLSSDVLDRLDERGLALTRALLRPSAAAPVELDLLGERGAPA